MAYKTKQVDPLDQVFTRYLRQFRIFSKKKEFPPGKLRDLFKTVEVFGIDKQYTSGKTKQIFPVYRG